MEEEKGSRNRRMKEKVDGEEEGVEQEDKQEAE